MLKNLFTALFILGIIPLSFAQGIKGKVVDAASGAALPGVSITVQGAARGTASDAKGDYTLTIAKGTYKIKFGFVGYETQLVDVTIGNETKTLNISLKEGTSLLNEIVVTGTRSGGRSKIDSPVPVDVIAIAQVTNNVGQVDLNQILNYLAPSFQSSRQTVTDGSDHVDPAQLRGLGSDQVLVLVNGKRRHQTALVNVNGTVNKGTVGTDLNAIPANSVEKIEILRDGAAAQYGSDAIAGVINIVLKKQEGLSGNVSYGSNVTSYDKNYVLSKGTAPSQSVVDGGTTQVGLNYGFKLGEKGFLNLTGEFTHRNASNRTGTYTGQVYPSVNGVVKDDSILAAKNLTRNDFDLRFGNAKVTGYGLEANGVLPISQHLEVYAFGGFSSKDGNAAGFYRYPNSVPASVRSNVLSVYPNGFLPEISSTVSDASAVAGIRGKLGAWNVDLSNTYGKNVFDFTIENSVNYTQAISTNSFQRKFDAGGLAFAQNTINLDLSKKYEILAGLNVALGAEYRVDKFSVKAGEESSYKNYNVASGVAAGSQVFSGFLPSNAGDFSRNNVGVYLDLEQDFNKRLVVDAALRYENYSDFGSTLNYKVATRFKVTDGIALRASTSTGFRAPSLQQRFYAKTNTLVTNGVFYETGTFTNESKPAEILGIPKLKQETSQSFTVGATAQLTPHLELTVDAYQIDIDNRIILTNSFSGGGDAALTSQLEAANATTANFFANAIDTRSRGLETVLSYNTKIGKNNLKVAVSGAFIENEVKKNADGTTLVHASDQLIKTGQVGQYFTRADQSRIELGIPKNKISLLANYKVDKWGFFVRVVNFGAVTSLASKTSTYDPANPSTFPVNTLTGLKESLDQTFSAKTTMDVSLSYDVTKQATVTFGANNVFDVYPDKFANSGNTSTGRFVYSNIVQQQGFNGRYIFGRINFKF